MILPGPTHEDYLKTRQLYKTASRNVDEARAAYQRYLEDGEITDELIRCAVHLARIDLITGGYRSSLALAFESGVRLEDYICGTCGFVESYLEDLQKIDKIKIYCSPISHKQSNQNPRPLI